MDATFKRALASPTLIVWVLCALLGGGCKTDIQSGIESANDLLYNKQYVAAERLYHKLLKRLGEDEELSRKQDEQRLLILDRLGKVNALYLHDYAKAIHFYERLVRLYPKTEQAFAALAMVADIHHHKLGDLQAAITDYQKLVAEFPDRSETRWAQLQISGAFFQLKDYDQARTEAEAVIARWPNATEASQARSQIANAYYVQGRYTEAIATYERLLAGNPEPSLASLVLFELGNCFQELNDFDRALAYYYACLADHPNPLLVQRKIQRVRARMRHVRPSEEIQLPDYVRQRLAVMQGASGDRSATTAQPEGRAASVRARERDGDAPETGVFEGSPFDENEAEVSPSAKDAAESGAEQQRSLPPMPPSAPRQPAGAGAQDKALQDSEATP